MAHRRHEVLRLEEQRHVQAAAALLAASEHEVWPLQLVDLRDGDQVEELYRLMRLVPEVIEFYLDDYVFPKTAKHQGMKLSATGQELGGDLIFPRRLGFSGTPSDLLPLELGAPKFEPGTDAKVLATLTDVDVVSARDLGGDSDDEPPPPRTLDFSRPAGAPTPAVEPPPGSGRSSAPDLIHCLTTPALTTRPPTRCGRYLPAPTASAGAQEAAAHPST